MNTSIIPPRNPMKSGTEDCAHPMSTLRIGCIGALLKKSLIAKMGMISDGELEMVEPGGIHRFGHASDLRGKIEVLDQRTWERVALHGTVGFAECFMDGWVRMDDPVSVTRLFVRNRHAMRAMETGVGAFSLWLLKLWHAARANTRAGSRRNIAAHYDLGNEFYRLWLDESMMYSSAIWETPEQSLEEAEETKIDRICRKLALEPGMRILEIGTGWGGFAIHAAGRHGCHVTTTTISRRQHELALQRVEAAGLSDRITILQQDYRDLKGIFDRVVSIEMVEAIGWKQFPVFFQTIGDALKPDGAALIQAITILDQRYLASRLNVDFIQRHIFPGSCIPSIMSLLDAATSSSDLALIHLEDIGPHYARTLREWRKRFLAHLPDIKALGFDDRFLRMWEWYLSYCEGGFMERQLGDAQLLFAKPRWAGAPLLGRF